MTTVSSASGGARISRHEKASRPCREALPQRVRWSRTLSAAGLTPRAVACRATSRSMAARARGLSHASRTARGRAPVGRGEVDDQLVLVRPTDPFDRRPPDAGSRRHDAQAMEVAPVPDRGAIAQAAAGRERGAIARLLGQVPPDPRLPLGEELLDPSVGVRPAASGGEWDGDDHPAVRVDDDPQAARPRRASQGVRDRAAGEPGDGVGLGGGHVQGDQVRRNSRPARSPVSAPSTMAGRPLTNTWSMPIG